MSHDIANINGIEAMFCVGDRDAAWHKLGQRTGQVVTWQEAVKLAQLDWNVVKHPMFTRGLPKADGSRGDVFQIPNQVAVLRDVDSAYLGVVGDGFELIQNAEMFTYLDGLIGAMNGAHYETAGALGNGALVWGLAKLPVDSRILNTQDVTKNYLMFASAHDGSMSVIYKLVAERVVCHNTLNIALGEAGKQLKFKHTRNVRSRMADAAKAAVSIRKEIGLRDEMFNTLAKRKVTKASIGATLSRLFPQDADGEVGTRTKNTIMQILELFESNDKNAIPEIRGTAYNLLNACTEYSDHFRSVRITEAKQGQSTDYVRAEGAMFGTGDKFKSDALTAVLECTDEKTLVDAGTVSTVGNSDWLKAMGIRF